MKKLNKITKVGFILSLVFTSYFVLGKEKNVVTQDRPVKSFNSIEIGSAFKVFLKSGDKESLQIEADDSIQSQIITEVKNNKLSIHTKGTINNPSRMNVYITFKQLTSLNVSGACSLECDFPIKTDLFKLEVSGAAKIKLNLDVKNLETNLSGAGKVNLVGNAENHKIEVSGAAKYHALQLISNHVTVNVSGASNLFVYAKNKIDGQISGVGSVYYKGNPTEKSVEISGLGKCKPVDEKSKPHREDLEGKMKRNRGHRG